MITNNSELLDFLAKIKNDKVIAIDTEFLRINTYYPKACLIQIATSSYSECIDILLDINLEYLFAKLYHQDTLLVFHSARQDLEVLYNLSGCLPLNIFDTQICANFLGYSGQLSYANLVKDSLKIELPKAYSRFDWSRRPLPADVIQYALDDVIYLISLYYKFKNFDYYEFILQDCQQLLNEDLYKVNYESAYKKVKGLNNLGKKYQNLAINLSIYREHIAVKKNKPRKWIFSDQTLFDYATSRIKIPEKIIKNLSNLSLKIKKLKPASATEKKQINTLQKIISVQALKYNLTTEMIANKKDILKFIRGEKSKLNYYWRHKIMINIKQIDAGNLPDCINVIIEIPSNSDPIKYELDKDTNTLFVDRFMSSPMFYPANYGFVPQTLADDGDPADVLVITPYPLMHNCVIKARPVGVLEMTDDGGVDAKILAVPFGKLSTEYDDILDINDVPKLLKNQIEHFFAHYKDLEEDKWVKIDGWSNVIKAKEILVEAQKNYQK